MNAQSHRPPTAPSVSDRSAQGVLLGVIALFAVVLVGGWSKLLAPTLPADLALAAWLLAAGIAVIAVVLAKGVAAEKVRLNAVESNGNPESDKTWMAYFAVLFVISALGTMNTAFYFGEGRLVLTEALDRTRQNLDALQATAPKALRNLQLEQKQATINRLLASLEGEITNANGGKSCGVGDSARRIIRELAVELPGFREFSGGVGVHACAGSEGKFKEVAASYRRQANQLLHNHPAYVEANGARADALLVALRERVADEVKKIDAAKAALSGGEGGTFKAGGSYAQAQYALESAATTYVEMLVELEKSAVAPSSLPRTISVDQARQLGSIAQIIPSLLARLDRVSTWIYFVFAISLDVILIMCFMRVLCGDDRSNVTQGARTGAGRSTEPDLRFLWVNP